MIHALYKNFMNQEIQERDTVQTHRVPQVFDEDPMGSRRHDTHSDDGRGNDDQC